MRNEGPDEVGGIVDAIAREGVAVVPGFLDDAHVVRLRDRVSRLDAEARFVPAGIGRATAQVHVGIRGDRIHWLELPSNDASEDGLARALDHVRREVNRGLALGAFDLELHYAIYPPGKGYARHRDRFRDDDARVLSCVVYLNDGWREVDGGALRLHLDAGPRDVTPQGGTLVAFLSDRVEHEVLPARRERLAVAGWFRHRGLPGRSSS
jgi:SM-20-related protein